MTLIVSGYDAVKISMPILLSEILLKQYSYNASIFIEPVNC